MLCIIDKASKVTRRSAGIPALIGGLLAACPEQMMQDVFYNLHHMAMSPVLAQSGFQDADLPQVHALNCLKSIYVDTKIAAYSDRYIERGLKLAVHCLESHM